MSYFDEGIYEAIKELPDYAEDFDINAQQAWVTDHYEHIGNVCESILYSESADAEQKKLRKILVQMKTDLHRYTDEAFVIGSDKFNETISNAVEIVDKYSLRRKKLADYVASNDQESFTADKNFVDLMQDDITTKTGRRYEKFDEPDYVLPLPTTGRHLIDWYDEQIKRNNTLIEWLTPDGACGDLLDALTLEPRFLIDGLLPENSLGEMFGSSTHYKTFIILNMLFCIAHGIPFHGREVKQGRVIYMAGEGREGLLKRLTALSEHYGVPLDRNMFLVPDINVDLLDKDSVQSLANFLRTKGKSEMIVFDTLPSYTRGMDTNGDTHWNVIKGNLQDLISPLVNVISWVMHTNLSSKDRAKGTGQRFNDSDFVLQVKRDKTKTSIIYRKVKDGEHPEPIEFTMKSVAGSLVPTLKVDVKLNATDDAVMKIIGKSVATHDEFNDAVEAVYNPDGDKPSNSVRQQRLKIRKRLEKVEVLEITE